MSAPMTFWEAIFAAGFSVTLGVAVLGFLVWLAGR